MAPKPNRYFQYLFKVTKATSAGYYTVSQQTGFKNGYIAFDDVYDGNGDSSSQIGDVTGDQYGVYNLGVGFVTEGVYRQLCLLQTRAT